MLTNYYDIFLGLLAALGAVVLIILLCCSVASTWEWLIDRITCPECRRNKSRAKQNIGHKPYTI